MMTEQDQLEYLKSQLTLATRAQDDWRMRAQSWQNKYELLKRQYDALCEDIEKGVNGIKGA